MKIVKTKSTENYHFTAMKNRCILHGRVFVMLYDAAAFISISVLCSIPLANGADNTYIENTLTDYFSKPRHHEVDQAYKDRSMVFIHDEFQRYGLETEYHEFHDPRVSDTVRTKH